MTRQQEEIFNPPASISQEAHVKSLDEYRALYRQSIEDPDTFWSEQAERLDWMEPFNEVQRWDYNIPKIEWFIGGKLNVSVNCLDRHVMAGKGDHTALIWEGNDPSESKNITYAELLKEVCRFANVLKSNGIKKGDRICIYLPMVLELPIAMLACARIGAVHSIVFGGFSADSLRSRILDSQCSVLITADEGLRGPKKIPLKGISNEALEGADCTKLCIVVRRTGSDVPMQSGRDVYWDELIKDASDECEPEAMDSEDPLFILYTSGSTGKPKGVLHTTGGYLLYTSMTHQ